MTLARRRTRGGGSALGPTSCPLVEVNSTLLVHPRCPGFPPCHESARVSSAIPRYKAAERIAEKSSLGSEFCAPLASLALARNGARRCRVFTTRCAPLFQLRLDICKIFPPSAMFAPSETAFSPPRSGSSARQSQFCGFVTACSLVAPQARNPTFAGGRSSSSTRASFSSRRLVIPAATIARADCSVILKRTTSPTYALVRGNERGFVARVRARSRAKRLVELGGLVHCSPVPLLRSSEAARESCPRMHHLTPPMGNPPWRARLIRARPDCVRRTFACCRCSPNLDMIGIVP